MEPNEERMQDRLVSKLPRPGNLEQYRKEVALMLEKNDKSFLREKWGARVMWIFCVCLGTAYLWFGGAKLDTPKAAWFGCLACFWLLIGAVELLKHFINRSRVELLKEIKQIQLQVLEMQETMNRR
ncbi:MAG TPA: hypothetical protein VGL72_05385 [Bryobacteraceae bacterium]|jgi:hypothetical protein